jgi:hypothetical protein
VTAKCPTATHWHSGHPLVLQASAQTSASNSRVLGPTGPGLSPEAPLSAVHQVLQLGLKPWSSSSLGPHGPNSTSVPTTTTLWPRRPGHQQPLERLKREQTTATRVKPLLDRTCPSPMRTSKAAGIRSVPWPRVAPIPALASPKPAVPPDSHEAAAGGEGPGGGGSAKGALTLQPAPLPLRQFAGPGPQEQPAQKGTRRGRRGSHQLALSGTAPPPTGPASSRAGAGLRAYVRLRRLFWQLNGPGFAEAGLLIDAPDYVTSLGPRPAPAQNTTPAPIARGGASRRRSGEHVSRVVSFLSTLVCLVFSTSSFLVT